MISPARTAAFRALHAIRSGRVNPGEALGRSRDPLTDVRDRALATDLVTGTLRWRAAIDYQLQRFSAKPLKRLDADVLDALRLGAYQLLYLERVPVSAVVNDTVEIVKSSRFRSGGSFANAVLRRLSGQLHALTWPARPASIESDADRRALIDYYSIVHSHPAWLVERWITRYGAADAEAWLQFNNRPPPMTLAPNRLRITRDELAARLRDEAIDTAPTPVAPHGLTVLKGKVLTSIAFRDGACVVQDEASQIIPELMQADGRHRVLDACASPGGKTIALAAQCQTGVVLAADVRRRRVQLLAATLRRCGASHVQIVHVPDRGALPFRRDAFDGVLVDAPCSGLGTIRRDPDIRWRRSPADFPAFAQAQRELLLRVSPHVAPGGRLVYSTCSSEPEENEEVVAAFLSSAPAFAVVPLTSLLELPGKIVDMATREGYLKTTPLHGLEAFFGAVLHKSS